MYREGIELIPIIARAPQDERSTMENMRDIQIFSPTAGRTIPLAQVVDGFDTTSENVRISRRQRRSMITLHCDARTELPSVLFEQLKPKVEQALNVDYAAYLGKAIDPDTVTANTIMVKNDDMIPLKGMPGYFMAWAGDAEDSADAQKTARQRDSALFRIYGTGGDLPVQCLSSAFDHLADRAPLSHRGDLRASAFESALWLHGHAGAHEPFRHAHQKRYCAHRSDRSGDQKRKTALSGGGGFRCEQDATGDAGGTHHHDGNDPALYRRFFSHPWPPPLSLVSVLPAY